jgi:hypothetical protein
MKVSTYSISFVYKQRNTNIVTVQNSGLVTGDINPLKTKLVCFI